MIRYLAFPLLLLLALPAAAQAGGSARVEGNRIVVTGTPGVDMIGVFGYPTAPGELSIEQIGSDASLGPQEAGPGCTKENRGLGGQRIYCPTAGVTEVTATLSDGDDRLTLSLPLTTTADMGRGDDFLEDVESGGAFALGDGDDEARVKGASAITGGSGDDNLLCKDSNAPTRLKAAMRLDGGLGEDRICGGARDDRLEGGSADDKIYAGEGDDRVDGEAGDDVLEGGDDADRITGGSGEDEIDGGAGKDTIRAKDRKEDDVSCGSKRDTVFADRVDMLSRCETIRR